MKNHRFIKRNSTSYDYEAYSEVDIRYSSPIDNVWPPVGRHEMQEPRTSIRREAPTLATTTGWIFRKVGLPSFGFPLPTLQGALRERFLALRDSQCSGRSALFIAVFEVLRRVVLHVLSLCSRYLRRCGHRTGLRCGLLILQKLAIPLCIRRTGKFSMRRIAGMGVGLRQVKCPARILTMDSALQRHCVRWVLSRQGFLLLHHRDGIS